MKKHFILETIVIICFAVIVSGCNIKADNSQANTSLAESTVSTEPMKEIKRLDFKIVPEPIPEYNLQTDFYETDKYMFVSSDGKLMMVVKDNPKLIEIDSCTAGFFYNGKYILYTTHENNKREYKLIELDANNNAIIKKLNFDTSKFSQALIVNQNIYWQMYDNKKVYLVCTDINGKNLKVIDELSSDEYYTNLFSVHQARYLVYEIKNANIIMMYDTQTKQTTKAYDFSGLSEHCYANITNNYIIIEDFIYDYEEYILKEHKFIIVGIPDKSIKEFGVDLSKLKKGDSGESRNTIHFSRYLGGDEFYFINDFEENTSEDVPGLEYKYNFSTQKYEFIKEDFDLGLNPYFDLLGCTENYKYYAKYDHKNGTRALERKNIDTGKMEALSYSWKVK